MKKVLMGMMVFVTLGGCMGTTIKEDVSYYADSSMTALARMRIANGLRLSGVDVGDVIHHAAPMTIYSERQAWRLQQISIRKDNEKYGLPPILPPSE